MFIIFRCAMAAKSHSSMYLQMSVYLLLAQTASKTDLSIRVRNSFSKSGCIVPQKLSVGPRLTRRCFGRATPDFGGSSSSSSSASSSSRSSSSSSRVVVAALPSPLPLTTHVIFHLSQAIILATNCYYCYKLLLLQPQTTCYYCYYYCCYFTTLMEYSSN